MHISSIFIGTLAYLVVVFPLGYYWHLVAFKERLDAVGFATQEKPIIAFGFLSMLVQGVILAMFFDWARSEGPLVPMIFAVNGLFAVVIWSAQILAHAGKFKVDVRPFLTLQTAYFAVQAVLVAVAYVVVFGVFGL